MKEHLPLPQEKKLTVLYRLEPGCLGPDGVQHIESFCRFAQLQFESFDTDFIHWSLVPRYDKSLVEMQYLVGNKNLSHDKVEKYLAIFDKRLVEFEEHLHDKLAQLIDNYLEQ